MARQCLYGAARIGDIVVISYFRPARGLAVVVLSAVALTLASCGRKGGLDLPPSASGAPPTQAQAADSSDPAAASHGNLFNPSYGSDAPPQAAKGQKKAFIMDPLLGDPYQGK
jgi:predicted small lipoprotein YifL